MPNQTSRLGSRDQRTDPAAVSSPGQRRHAASVPAQNLVLVGDHIELNQLLKLAGACDSGGAGKALVASGAVRVDGRQELRKTCKIRAGQTVQWGELRINVVAAGTGPASITDIYR